MSDERKPLWPWIVAVLIGLPLLYVASFGPVCWYTASQMRKPRIIAGGPPRSVRAPRIFWPIGWLALNSSPQIGTRIFWYGRLMARRFELSIPTGPDGTICYDSLTHYFTYDPEWKQLADEVEADQLCQRKP